ncbi:ABC transporter ATP-binding protein [Desulfocurvus sp. DL9XJH121]
MIDIDALRLDFPGFCFGPASLRVDGGSFFALMGPTGSGKTLMLECLAGLTAPHAGAIRINGRDVTGDPPERRRIGLVYQDNALFPHMTVLRNILYGQRYHGIDPERGRAYGLELAEMLDITRLLDRLPAKLSGGEKQRVALARALACSPDIVLLDEPLSSLDPQFRDGLRANLKGLHQATGAVFFMVTHDFVDALTLADHCAVIHKGRIVQTGPTLDIFHKPATTFIAGFVGMENIFPAVYEQGYCRFAGLSVPTGGGPQDGAAGYAALRPEDVIICRNGDSPLAWVSARGRVASVARQGFSWAATVLHGDARFTARLEHRLVLDGSVREGADVTLAFDPAAVHHIPDTATGG